MVPQVTVATAPGACVEGPIPLAEVADIDHDPGAGPIEIEQALLDEVREAHALLATSPAECADHERASLATDLRVPISRGFCDGKHGASEVAVSRDALHPAPMGADVVVQVVEVDEAPAVLNGCCRREDARAWGGERTHQKWRVGAGTDGTGRVGGWGVCRLRSNK